MNRSLLHDLDASQVGVLLARLLAISDDAVILTDAQLRIVLFNEGAERIFGHRAADVVGEPLSRLLPEPVREGHAQRMRAFAAAGQASRRMAERRDIHGRRADGSYFDAEASIAFVELDTRLYYAAILRDVSEARRAERALMRSEARFRSLAETAPVGIFQTNTRGDCIYVNDRWSELAGMSQAEAAGQGWLRALHPADRARVQRAWAEALEGNRRFGMRYRFLRPDGTQTWVMGNSEAHREADGRIDGLLGTVTDVTESHEQALALERAKSEAEAAVRAKGLFLANMSHEIRTPLNAVIGMTTLLLDTPMSEDQRECARTIRSSGESLLAIINDILDFSKADVGKLEIEQQAFDLRRCVEDALDQVAPRALDRGLNLACLFEDGTPEWLVGDVVRVRQILVNLLSNAVKFTHQGEVLVVVESEPLSDGLHRIHVAVKDSGIGIEPDHLPRLFHSFTQVDASTTRKYGGTGLGLAICKRLAELMGGEVSVDSEPGRGSVFHARFVARAAQPDEPAEFHGRDVPPLAGKRLLIVDGNLTNRRILTRLAMRWGMRASTLPSALEAIDRIRHGEAFDIALVDRGLPGMDGVDLASEIRGLRPQETLPILLMSAVGPRRASSRERAAEFDGVVSKPIRASALFAAMAALLRGRAQTASAPVAAAAASQAPARRALRVLVAEDHVVNQRVAQRLLQRLGYHADVAGNGLEAIDAIEHQHYDVVLMDIQMPEMDGLQVTRWIRQRHVRGEGPRIVAMTANAMPGDREIYLAAGMDDYVAKPIELAALSAAIERVSPRPPTPPDPPPRDDLLDPARLDHLRSLQDEGQPSLVGELIDLFIADTPGHVDALGDALRAADAGRLRSVAHRFLSVTQNIGARRMSALCVELEALARSGCLDAAPPLISRLDQERVWVRDALAELRPGEQEGRTR